MISTPVNMWLSLDCKSLGPIMSSTALMMSSVLLSVVQSKLVTMWRRRIQVNEMNEDEEKEEEEEIFVEASAAVK